MEPGASAQGNSWERNQAPRQKRMRGSGQEPSAGSPDVEGTHSDTAHVKRPPADTTPSLAKRARAAAPGSFVRIPVEVLVDDLQIKYKKLDSVVTGIGSFWNTVSGSVIPLRCMEIGDGVGVSQRVGKTVIGRKICLRLWIEGIQGSDTSGLIRVVIVRRSCGAPSQFLDNTTFGNYWLQDTTIGDINSIPNPQFFGDDKQFQLLVDEVIKYPARKLAVSTIATDFRAYHLDLGNEIWQWRDEGFGPLDYTPVYYMAICGGGFGSNINCYHNTVAMFSDF